MNKRSTKNDDNEEYLPLHKRFPDLINEFDDTLRDSVSELNSDWMEFYALDIQSISELEDRISNKSNLKVLKLMHWNSLTSSQGIDDYINIEHLDLSLNQLESFEAEKLWDLIILNLSCNSIKQAPNLKNFWMLKIIDLSHNRITDLSPFLELSVKKNWLAEINLDDNMISDIDQVGYLSKFLNLTKIQFQDKKRSTDNPIWELSNYSQMVCTYLAQLKELDGVKVIIKEKENTSSNKMSIQNSSTKSIESGSNSKQILPVNIKIDDLSSAQKSTAKKYKSPFEINPVPETPLKIPMKLHEKDELICELHNQVTMLRIQSKEAEEDKDQALSQLETIQVHFNKI